jgi:hypothetical protein
MKKPGNPGNLDLLDYLETSPIQTACLQTLQEPRFSFGKTPHQGPIRSERPADCPVLPDIPESKKIWLGV